MKNKSVVCSAEKQSARIHRTAISLKSKPEPAVTRILSIQNATNKAAPIPWDESAVEITRVDDSKTALSLILEKRYDGVYFSGVPECLA